MQIWSFIVLWIIIWFWCTQLFRYTFHWFVKAGSIFILWFILFSTTLSFLCGIWFDSTLNFLMCYPISSALASHLLQTPTTFSFVPCLCCWYYFPGALCCIIQFGFISLFYFWSHDTISLGDVYFCLPGFLIFQII